MLHFHTHKHTHTHKYVQVQQAVLPAVVAAAPINPSLFSSILTDCKHKHRSPKLCDEALQHAATLEKHKSESLE
jgi:hypothetical protein